MTDEEKKAKIEKIKQKYNEFMKVYPLNPQSLIDEIWTDIEGYEGHYQISNYGRAKSFKNGRETILRPLWTNGGYLNFSLCLNGKHKNFSPHVLVAKAFIPNPENKPEVNHIDSDKFNCCVDNLEWSTRSENNRHAFKNGLNHQAQGENNIRAKLTNEQAKRCREVYKPFDRKFGIAALAKKFKITVKTMYNVIHGKSYKDA